MNNKVFIRADASVDIGSGHVMRCLILAEELRKNAFDVTFICRELDGNLINHIQSKLFSVIVLNFDKASHYRCNFDSEYEYWLGCGLDDEISEMQSVMRGMVDLIVVDHYAIDFRWEEAMRKFAKKIMVIDDMVNRKHDCDIFLSHHYYQDNASRYKKVIPHSCISLLGPKYALINSTFKKNKPKVFEKIKEIKKILIFFGGSDPRHLTLSMLDFIITYNQLLAGFNFMILVGGQNSDHQSIEDKVKRISNVSLRNCVEDFSKLLSQFDLFIHAGGGVCLERSCLGVVGLVTSFTENQREVALSGSEVFHFYFDWHSLESARFLEIFLNLTGNMGRVNDLRLASYAAVDGDGAARVFKVIKDEVCHEIKFA